MIAGCSSGIEPIFALAFEHRVRQPDGERVLTFVNETFERIAKEQGFYSDALMREIAKRGSLHGIRGLPEHATRVFKTSHEVGFEWHVRHQAAFQRSTDNGVSKTINLPNSASEEDVARAYRLAWELGCLGITVFRDGCKGEQVLNVGIGAKKDKAAAAIGPMVIKPRPHSLKGSTYRMETPIGTAFITVNETPEGDAFEVFIQVGVSQLLIFAAFMFSFILAMTAGFLAAPAIASDIESGVALALVQLDDARVAAAARITSRQELHVDVRVLAAVGVVALAAIAVLLSRARPS